MTPAFRSYLEQLVQGSDEWHANRRGCITASNADRLLSLTTKTLPAFVRFLQAEGADIGNVPSVRNGRENEPVARAHWEMLNGRPARQVGLLVHPDFALCRCSPDFVADPDGGGEIKCPTNPVEHLRTLAGVMPQVHIPQVQFSLWTSRKAWWDFVSFMPTMPARRRYACIRLTPCAATFRLFEARVQLVLPCLDGGLKP